MSFGWTTWRVTPQTDAAVAAMTAACPCTSTPAAVWEISIERVLTTCATGSCLDTSFLGGTAEVNDASSIVMDGFPVYANILIDSTAGTGSVTLSQQFSNAEDGVAASITTDTVKMPIAADGTCPAVTTTDNFCGGWGTGGGCIPAMINKEMVGILEVYNYYGPPPGPDTSGVYNRTRTVYGDTNCKLGTEYVTLYEEGTMAFPAASTTTPETRPPPGTRCSSTSPRGRSATTRPRSR